jgi:hypothetical protein
MHFSTVLLALAAPLLAFAAPVRRSETVVDPINAVVFNFAHTLELLESQFYTQALSKFQDSDFLAAGFTSAQIPSQFFTGILSDETAHTTFLENGLAALGQTPLSGCQFDFSTILTDVSTMASAARIIENVGVGAYLGGAALLTQPAFIEAAATILTVEARHQTILNVLNSGSAIPQSFDVALSPSEVLAIAGQFISGCDLGIPANPVLSITNTGTVAPGTLLTFSSSALNSSTQSLDLHCQMMLGGMSVSIPLPIGQCVVPTGVNGPVVIFISKDGQPLLNDVIDRGTAQIVAGPTMAFIDTQPQMLGMLARNPNNSSNSQSSSSSTTASAPGSLSTTTISPDQAQSLLSSISAAATATSTSTSTSTAAASSITPPSDQPPSNIASSSFNPNMFTGPVDNGAMNVDGWSSVAATAVPSPQ